MPIWQCEGSTSRFDSDPHNVCPVLGTDARRIVTVYYRVLISQAPARVGKGHSSTHIEGGLRPRPVPEGNIYLCARQAPSPNRTPI